MAEQEIQVPIMADVAAEGKTIDVLFWVGCAGSFDDRAQRITRDFIKILHACEVNYAVLGPEESCTGDPAKRAGNEFLFQMQAMQNIEVLNSYEIKRIVTACPHCFNTIKNEYPQLGGEYEVMHHSQFLNELLASGKMAVQGGSFKGRKVAYHDSCYLGRANEVYEAPRQVIEQMDADLVELKRCRQNGLCCGAGGAQMFKDPEKTYADKQRTQAAEQDYDVNVERTKDVLEAKPDYVAVACPFCMTMMSDGVKYAEKQDSIKVLDLAEFVARANGLTKD